MTLICPTYEEGISIWVGWTMSGCVQYLQKVPLEPSSCLCLFKESQWLQPCHIPLTLCLLNITRKERRLPFIIWTKHWWDPSTTTLLSRSCVWRWSSSPRTLALYGLPMKSSKLHKPIRPSSLWIARSWWAGLASGSWLWQNPTPYMSPQKAVKGQALADFLAAHPIPDDSPLITKPPDKEVMITKEVRPP